MRYNEFYASIAVDDLPSMCRKYKSEGYRLAQIHPVLKEDGTITMYYTFVKANEVVNLKIEKVIKGVTEIPSVTPYFLSQFVFENEAHDLFGVNIVGNVLDFHGEFYQFAEGVEAPMTIISQAQLEAREKKARIEKAKAAKAAKAKREAEAKAKAEAEAAGDAQEQEAPAQEAPQTQDSEEKGSEE